MNSVISSVISVRNYYTTTRLKKLSPMIYQPLKVVLCVNLCYHLASRCNQFSNPFAINKEDHLQVVEVPGLGLLRGFIQQTSGSGRDFLSFTGISYGSIPARFSIAELRTTLDLDDKGVFDATRPQKACIQPVLLPFLPGNFTEECLTLNIHTLMKQVWESENLLPVIVFIHGGSFFRWSGSMFSGKRILNEDVLLVTINYRLSVFGFFCLENDDAPGNLALYDQILALQWIQKHIRHFGGDPAKVTIAGQSAGGSAVTYLLDSPLAQGLFHQVITSSGDSFAGWAVQHHPLRNSLTAATILGCANGTASNQDFQVVLQCMRNLPSEKILEALPSFFSAPSVQTFPLKGTQKVLPRRNTEGPRFHSNVPLMIGLNRQDGAFLLSRIYNTFLKTRNKHKDVHYLNNHFVHELLISSHFGIKDNGTVGAITRKFLREKHRESFSEMAPGLTNLYSHFYFMKPAHQTALKHSEEADVYLYMLEYEGKQTLYPYTGGVPEVPRGVSHGDDLMYLFHFEEFTTPEEERVSSDLIRYWVNFAATGNPNKNTIQEPSKPDFWPKFQKHRQHYLRLREVTVVEPFQLQM